jgi:putative ABC transport system permease protein
VDFFAKELLLRLSQLPGVEASGMTSTLPVTGNNGSQAFLAEGYVPPKGANMNLANPSSVRGDYFRTMKIPLLRGRLFTEADTASAPLVAIVDRKLAQHFWPDQDPIGKRLRIGTPELQTPWLTIVGEVADVRLNSPDTDPTEQMYEPVEQSSASLGALATPTDVHGRGGYIVLRSALPAEQMENALRATVRSIDPQLPLAQVQTMEQAVSDSGAPRRFNTALITSFAFAAVLLAILGIYSVIAFSVAQRVQEMAIRMALGSQPSGVMRLVLTSGAKLAVVGCTLGLLGAFAASGLLRSFLFGVTPFDPLVLALAASAIFVLAVTATLPPALRASSIEPMQALRAE